MSRKILKSFRIDLKDWKEFKEKTGWDKSTRIIREFVLWYNKFNDLWLPLKYFLSDNVVCSICGEESELTSSPFEPEEIKEKKGKEALKIGWRFIFIISHPYSEYRDFEVDRGWICPECFEKLFKGSEFEF